jgi:hypothetical protein
MAQTSWGVQKLRGLMSGFLFKAFLIFVVSVFTGVIFGMLYEKWNFGQSLLFAVSALSTGGLESPTTDNTGMWFAGFYCLFGVPVYGYLLASAAGFIESKNGDAQKAAILTKFSARDSEFLMRIDEQGDGVDWGEFLEIFLLKLDLASPEDLENIREKFNKMDVDHSGKLDIRELNVELAFSKADVDGSGEIDFQEFIKLLVHLYEVRSSMLCMCAAVGKWLFACLF